jgi:NTP pyrophosphatase (non-canonical NTP hydrolase)
MMSQYSTNIGKVKEFWKARNEKTGTYEEPSVSLAARLFIEETDEVLEALDYDYARHEILKELCDTVYVLHAITMAYGMEDKFETAFSIVHANNMDKIRHGTIDENGKLIKPKHHPSVLPQLRKLLED